MFHKRSRNVPYSTKRTVMRRWGLSKKRIHANQDCSILWYKKPMLGFERTKCSKLLHSNSNRRSLLGSAVIRDYLEDGSILVRNCHAWKDCCTSWSELITDNGKIVPQSFPYQPEALEPSGQDWVFFWAGYRKIFLFISFFAQPPSPRRNILYATKRALIFHIPREEP